MFKMFLTLIALFGVKAHDCGTAVKLWKNFGKSTEVDEESPTKCCLAPEMAISCKAHGNGTIMDPVQILAM
jgi:hypothetical protein